MELLLLLFWSMEDWSEPVWLPLMEPGEPVIWPAPPPEPEGELAPPLAPGVPVVPPPAPPACASAKAVLSANTNTDVCRYFFMPVSPRLVDR
jgi:hypothetical protein